MRELEEYELENMYGGSILSGAAIGIAVVLAAVAAYRMVTSTKAKIKLPNGTDISFENPREKSASKNSLQTNNKAQESSKIVLNALDNKAQSFSSTPGNFLIKI